METERSGLGPLAAALAKAQAAFPAVPRDKRVTVTSKRTGQTYSFNYAPLDTILDKVRKPLSENGLAIVQMLDGTDLVTLLLHESGASLSGKVALPRDPNGDVQQLGSAITYLRRYALQAMLGIAAEEDDDGNTAAGNRATPAQRGNGNRPQRVDPQTGEIVAPLQAAPRASGTAQGRSSVSEADISALHGRFDDADDAAFTAADIDAAVTAGLSSAELFSLAEEAGITRGQLTFGAKKLFGADRWRITDLSDQERLALWEEVGPVPA